MTQQQQSPAQQIEQLMAIIKRQEEENAKLKANKSPSLGIKVSAKGAVSVYGMGRFPVTLYRSQWTKLIELAPEITKFMAANASLLKEKE